MKRVQQGFTLIELMIVVAIIGILAAVAIPAYQDYTIRAKMSEAIGLAAAAKTSVSEYRLSENAYPTDNTAAGISDDIQSEFVAAVDVSGGRIFVAINSTNVGADGTLEFSPTFQNSTVQWVCKPLAAGSPENKYLPSNCRD